ncbi:RHS repeat-associated core domain-containing protein [Psychromonas sp. Urea-02u-13]|uniref:RHS repeat-associated core domain-containing protein n=1 Tax=Psychromonas sp. Urea-02u-13 TaxID=2058326 RepID=UPI0018E3E37B|nr:RHS repeat-associated core domain-containing protein [Psychromonas sp. Urea-02u-13]
MLNKKTMAFSSVSRRNFIKGGAALAASSMVNPIAGHATSIKRNSIISNPLGFNGEYKDPVTGSYFLGNGYRFYSPTLMRFNANDSLSPFGKGGVNSYAYCLGDPVNNKDPSGHLILSSIIIGAIVGATVGALFSTVTEVVKAGITGEKPDLKQIGIGAALGAFSGGIGGASILATKTSVQIGMAVVDALGAAGIGMITNVKLEGQSVKDAGYGALVDIAINLSTFGLGNIFGSTQKSIQNRMRVDFENFRAPRMVIPDTKKALRESNDLANVVRSIIHEPKNKHARYMKRSKYAKGYHDASDEVSSWGTKAVWGRSNLKNVPRIQKLYLKHYVGKGSIKSIKKRNRSIERMYADSADFQLALHKRSVAARRVGFSNILDKYVFNTGLPDEDTKDLISFLLKNKPELLNI